MNQIDESGEMNKISEYRGNKTKDIPNYFNAGPSNRSEGRSDEKFCRTAEVRTIMEVTLKDRNSVKLLKKSARNAR